MKKADRLMAEVEALEIGDRLSFKDYSEYMPIEYARHTIKHKKFKYEMMEESPYFSLLRVS